MEQMRNLSYKTGNKKTLLKLMRDYFSSTHMHTLFSSQTKGDKQRHNYRLSRNEKILTWEWGRSCRLFQGRHGRVPLSQRSWLQLRSDRQSRDSPFWFGEGDLLFPFFLWTMKWGHFAQPGSGVRGAHCPSCPNFRPSEILYSILHRCDNISLQVRCPVQ